jgi:hypothetical protein
MTYMEAITEIKQMPLSKPSEIKAKVMSYKDLTLINKICAKWWYIVSKDLKYTPEPVPPQEYMLMKTHIDARDEGWKNYWAMPSVQLFVETKRDVNMINLKNFKSLVWALENLDDSEVKAIECLEQKAREFLDGRKRERERPLGGFDFAEREVPTRSGLIQRRDSESMGAGRVDTALATN